MTRRTTASALGLALVLVLLQAAGAGAEYRGTDVWGNLTPVSHIGGLIDRYPIGNYQLDYHVSVGVTHMDDAFAGGLQVLGSLWFLFLTWLVELIIAAFNWATNVDVVTGPHGLLSPVGSAGQHFYYTVISPLLEIAIVVLACWAGWKYKNKEGHDTNSVLARAIGMAVVAMVIVFQPAATIGRANDLSTQLASQIASTGGDIANNFFKTFVYRPYLILQFGSLDKVCTSDQKDSDGFPVAASYGHPGARVCHSGYVDHFLPYAHGSTTRDDSYDALNKGTKPFSSSLHVAGQPQNDPNWQVDRTDAPAVDMMQAGGTVQRMAILLLLTGGIGCAIWLLGKIALALLFSQMVLLLLVVAAPIVVIVSIFPWTQWVFNAWGKLLGQLLIGKSMFIALLVMIITISTALTSVESTYGYLFMFTLQTALFAGGIYAHKQIAKGAMGAAHHAHEHSHHAAAAFVGGAAMTSVAVAAAPKDFMQRVWHDVSNRDVQEHAEEPRDSDHAAGDVQKPVSAPRPDSVSPPATAGREYSQPVPASVETTTKTTVDIPSTSTATVVDESSSTTAQGEEPDMPRSFREDLDLARAGEPQDNQEKLVAASVYRASVGPAAEPDNFASELERYRSERQAELER
jgi:hypothetical protein